MGSSQTIRALSALFFLSACSLAAAQRCTDTQAPKINSVVTEVRGVTVNGASGDQVAQDPADAETGSAVIKITGVIETLESCLINGVTTFSPPTSAILVITLANGVATNTETITTFVAAGNGLFNFEFNTQTSYLNGATQVYTYTVEAVNAHSSAKTAINPADATTASQKLGFKFATFAGYAAAVGALTAVSIGCPVTSASTMKATTFAPEVNVGANIVVTCCTVDNCVFSGAAGGNVVTLGTNVMTAPGNKLTLEKFNTATFTAHMVGHIFLSGTTALFNAIATWATVEIEGDASSTIRFDGAQTYTAASTLFTGLTTVDVNAQDINIPAGGKLFILEDVIWNAKGGTTNLAGDLIIGTNTPTASRQPGVKYETVAKCTGAGKITVIGGDLIFDGTGRANIADVDSACSTDLEKKTETTNVASHPTASQTSNPNLYCCFATCGNVINLNSGSTMIMGLRTPLTGVAAACEGLTPPKFIGKAGTISIAQDGKGGTVRFENLDTSTSNFQVTNTVSNTANGAIVATLGPNIPVTPATIKLFDQNVAGAVPVPQFLPSAPARRTASFSTVNGIWSILLGATILATPTQSNSVVSPIDPPSVPVAVVTSSSDDSSDKGIYGLFGLLLLPLLCSLAICYFMKTKTEKADAQYAQDTAAFGNVATAPTGQPPIQGGYPVQGGYAMA